MNFLKTSFLAISHKLHYLNPRLESTLIARRIFFLVFLLRGLTTPQGNLLRGKEQILVVPVWTMIDHINWVISFNLSSELEKILDFQNINCSLRELEIDARNKKRIEEKPTAIVAKVFYGHAVAGLKEHAPIAVNLLG